MAPTLEEYLKPTGNTIYCPRPEWIVPPYHSNLNNENRANTAYYAHPSSPLPTQIPHRVGNGTHFANRVRNGVFGPFAEWLDHKLRQREVEVHKIERLENALIENDIKVARTGAQLC